MPWLRVDDRMYANRKLRPVSNDAIALWIWAMDYSADQLTDGILGPDEVQMLAGMRKLPNWQHVAAELIEAGLFERQAAKYLVHDYLEYNPTRAKVIEDRVKNAQKQADYQARKKADKPASGQGANAAAESATNPRPNCVTNPVTNLVPYPVPGPYPGPDPIPGPKEKASRAAAREAAAGAAPLSATRENSAVPEADYQARVRADKPVQESPLSLTAEKFLEIMGRRRFRNATQRKAFEALEAEVGPEPICKAAIWAAENGIPNFDSFRTRARNIAKGIKPARASPTATTSERHAMVDRVLDRMERGESSFE